jgi:hypothetical protein
MLEFSSKKGEGEWSAAIFLKAALREGIIVGINLKEKERLHFCVLQIYKCIKPRLIIENESTKLNRLSERGPFRRTRVAESRVWREQCDTTILLRVEAGR